MCFFGFVKYEKKKCLPIMTITYYLPPKLLKFIETSKK